MDFKEYFSTSAEEINQELEIVLEKWVKEVEEINPKLKPLVQLLVDGCDGGKRIRGVLVKLGYEIAQSLVISHQSSEEKNLKADSERSERSDGCRLILQVAVAYEIFQTAILAHDDVIDLSPTRRGKQTIFQALGGDHYGISQAIGLGDAGFFLAVKLISQTDFPPEYKNKAITFFSDAMVKTALGEILDVELPHINQRREEDVLIIHKLKTAYYSVSAPLILGGILGGGKEELLVKLGEFGEKLGIAFQIQDDILGVFGSEEEIGKSNTSDIEEGKNTLLITQALKQATPKQKVFLEKYYGQGEIGVIGEIMEIFEETGALEYSQKMAEEYVKKAKKIIPEITEDLIYSKILEEMAEYLVNRSN